MNKAKEIINKRVVIGLSYFDHDGKFIESTQMYGKIVSVEANCVKVELEGSHKGEIFDLPRHMRAFKKAEPGTYTLKSTGEEIKDPDYTTTWKITKASEKS